MTHLLSSDLAAILLFHGVVKRLDYQVRKHIERDFSAELIRALKESGIALAMDEVVAHHINSTPFPQNSFVITFDDGFENNYSEAVPVLRDYSVPTTFYITSEFVDKHAMS